MRDLAEGAPEPNERPPPPQEPQPDPVKEAGALVEELRRIAEQVASFRDMAPEFLEDAAAAIVIVNSDGRIVFYNKKAVFLFGWLREEVIGQPLEVLLPEAIREHHAAVHRQGYMRDPYPRAMGANLDLRARHKDGSEFSVLIDLHPKMGKDGPYVQATVRRAPVSA